MEVSPKEELTPSQIQFAQREKRRAQINGFRHYKKSELIDMLHGVVDLPRDKVAEVFEAVSDLMTELAFKESVVYLPRFGKFIFEPKSLKKFWNPKEEKSLLYQNPRITFKPSHKLKTLLRKEYRRNCYQLAELNNLNPEDFKPAQKWTKLKKKDVNK